MRVRLVPAGLAVLSLLAVGTAYLKPTAAQLSIAQTRVQADEAQQATLEARQSILPRITAERQAIAIRLRGLRAVEAPVTEAHVLTDLAVLAKQHSLTLSGFAAKGAAVPLAAAAPATPPPTPVPSETPAASSALAAAEINATVPGIRMPRTITVSGRLGGILKFIDGLGAFPELLRVSGVSLVQNEDLRATIDFDIIVIDQGTLREALHG